MHGRIVALSLIALAVGLSSPAPASAEECEVDCGVPACYAYDVRVRPAMSRELAIGCRNLTGATLVSSSPEIQITEVDGSYGNLRFRALASQDAPREVEAVFDLTGQRGTARATVPIEVRPIAENSAPVCGGDRASRRTDGLSAVDLLMHPYCYDPDGDEFVMRGDGPGTHPESPKSVPAGSGESNWIYRPATLNGSETATIHATDVLGARSEDALLEVTVGPDVDRLPECHPNGGGWAQDGYTPVYARPGMPRNFAIICNDADGDPFAMTPGQVPERGALAAVPDAPYAGWSGWDQWYDATYVPTGDGLEPDRFSFVATGARGAGPEARMAIVPRPVPENGGGGCGWGGMSTAPGIPGVITIDCSDDEGDTLGVEIVAEPQSGTLGPAVVLPSRRGSQSITIPYVPDPGSKGYDCVKVRVSDGHGHEMTLTVDIWVQEVVFPDFLSPPPLPPVWLPQPLTPEAIESMVRDYARDALGTRHVERRALRGGAELWKPSKVSRSALRKAGQAPGVLVLCPAGCALRAQSWLHPARRATAARHQHKFELTRYQGQVLTLALDRRDRRRVRRASRPQARFALSLRAAGAASQRVRASVPIR